MKGKKGIELSINFIVMLIFSIAVFTFGIMIAKNMFTEAQEFTAEIDAGLEAEIDGFLTTGARVGIPRNKADIRAGETKVFGLGVLNTNDEAYDFYVMANANGLNNPLEILPKKTSTYIDINKDHKFAIAIKVPGGTPKGIYTVDVTVCYDDSITPPIDRQNNIIDGTCKPNGNVDFERSTINGMYLYKYATPQKIYVTVK